MNKDRSKDFAMYLIIKQSLNMSKGKSCAQVGHAVMGVVETHCKLTKQNPDNKFEKSCYNDFDAYAEWRKDCTKIVLKATDDQWEKLKKLPCFIVVDSGYTEIPPNSETVIAFWPMRKHEAPEIIKGLALA